MEFGGVGWRSTIFPPSIFGCFFIHFCFLGEVYFFHGKNAFYCFLVLIDAASRVESIPAFSGGFDNVLGGKMFFAFLFSIFRAIRGGNSVIP